MAQLNPNFEIDFNDINSYEQIQLINDTQLAKENLLMHRAYKEPSDDEIIRNHFSSFTFVDFCPKVFTSTSRASRSQSPQVPGEAAGGPSSSSSKFYELESFSDLFHRVNLWLRLNKDWRVVSLETLIHDCKSQFNYSKSSVYSNYLPQNTRGLRLFLSPSKSRFSGPQKIGCINVVPRKVSGSYRGPPSSASSNSDEQPVKYETLDDILRRLNELLLTKPIEGRILSVETITLPMVDGYVDTESNYFMDNRLNILNQAIYNPQMLYNNIMTGNGDCSRKIPSPVDDVLHGHTLIDILRVYYEFGPMLCGLVNLIDFIPKVYPSPIVEANELVASGKCENSAADQDSGGAAKEDRTGLGAGGGALPKNPTTESLTRLIRRSLDWFEMERKRILLRTANDNSSDGVVNLKVCNLQVFHKTMLRGQLIDLTGENLYDIVRTRTMAHERLQQQLTCSQCPSSDAANSAQFCPHLNDLNQVFNLKFVRLAYIVPVYNKYVARSLWSARWFNRAKVRKSRDSNSTSSSSNTSSGTSSSGANNDGDADDIDSLSDVDDEQSNEAYNHNDESDLIACRRGLQRGAAAAPSLSLSAEQRKANQGSKLGEKNPAAGSESVEAEEYTKKEAMKIIEESNEKHFKDEQVYQSSESAATAAPQTTDAQAMFGCAEKNPANGGGDKSLMIGQFTYRLFAPCQLVNSSSCFAINPVNSSSPLARRGSVDLNSGNTGENSPSDPMAPSSNANPLLASQSSLSGLTNSSILGMNSSHPIMMRVLEPHFVLGTIISSLSSQESGSGTSGGGAGPSQEQTSILNQSVKGKQMSIVNEFESVDAIRRRMEIYVTTNSMKILAGETLIINLNDNLSCLTTAIEQTIVRPTFVNSTFSSSQTWVSVYILYAAIDEPHLPGQLLAQQRMRELTLINEEEEEAAGAATGGGAAGAVLEAGTGGEIDSNKLFDDDFKEMTAERAKNNSPEGGQLKPNCEQQGPQPAEEGDSGSPSAQATLYNSAYDRTVPLPSQPDNNANSLVDFPNSRMVIMNAQTLKSSSAYGFDENELLEACKLQQRLLSREKGGRGEKSKKNRKKRVIGSQESQCLIM